MTKLICPECRRENEPERIYCHDCGAKLDRSAVISSRASQERVKETRKRLRHMFDPQRAKLRLLFFRISKLILGACATAAVLLMVLSPDVPPPRKEALALSQVGLEVENAITSHRSGQLQYSEEQINDYLVSALKNKQKALNKPFLDFKRALVRFQEGKCSITLERSFFGWPLYATSAYAVSVKEGKAATTNKGGAIGRLEIYPQLMNYLDILFADVWAALDRDRKLIGKLDAIEFHEKSVVLSLPLPPLPSTPPQEVAPPIPTPAPPPR